jgi:hypothetical protein
MKKPFIRVVLLLALATSLSGLGSPSQSKPSRTPASPFVPLVYSYLISAQARLYDTHGSAITAQFIIDTGSSMSQLNKASADALGLAVKGRRNAHALGGDRLEATVIVPKMCLSAVCSRMLEVQLVPDDPADTTHQNGGILGADFFNGHVLTIDYQNRLMALTPRPPRMPGYRSVMTAPITVSEGLSFVKCELPTTKQCNMLVDTANGETIVFDEDSAKFIHLGSVTRTTSMTSATGQTPIVFGPTPWLRIAGILKLTNVTVGLCATKITSPLSAANGPALLGNGIMDKYVVQLRYAEKTLRFLEKD